MHWVFRKFNSRMNKVLILNFKTRCQLLNDNRTTDEMLSLDALNIQRI